MLIGTVEGTVLYSSFGVLQALWNFLGSWPKICLINGKAKIFDSLCYRSLLTLCIQG
jgi:hypothetical protein